MSGMFFKRNKIFISVGGGGGERDGDVLHVSYVYH